MDTQGKMAKTEAEIDKMRAETAKILSGIGLDVRKQELSEYQAAEASQARATDQAMAAENAATERDFRARGEDRADRQQQAAEAQGGADG